jgi:putative glutamine amidotransferase
MRPLIGLTCLHDYGELKHKVNDTYINATKKAGGVPILLPCTIDSSEILHHLSIIQGLIVCGGPDADPRYFGEEPVPGLGGVNPAMDAYEIPLLKEALNRDMPILGICRGEQLLNIAAGGTLVQHIPDYFPRPLKHRQDAPRFYRTHNIEIHAGTLLSELLGSGPLLVNSYHHQAVREVAPGFAVSAVAPDGVIEAIESKKHTFAVGVQWHPECMWDYPDNYDSLFAGFVKAAQSYGAK